MEPDSTAAPHQCLFGKLQAVPALHTKLSSHRVLLCCCCQAEANEARRSKLLAEKAQVDEQAAAVATRLPELEAEKRAAASKKVGGRAFGFGVKGAW
jgi:hypothetical protein